jgi:hypothetical protein
VFALCVMRDVALPYGLARWLDQWLDRWLDGSMLTEDVFSLDASIPDLMLVLMPSSMQARCRLDASMPGLC